MIYHFQPFSVNKKIGEVYNGHCSLVPDSQEWISICDYDFLILTTDFYKIAENAIKRHSDTSVFSCMTNRVGYTYQMPDGKISDNDSIRHHIGIANELAEKYPNGECETVGTVAGFFMLFKKEYWEKNPFQEEIYDKNGNLFDYCFARYAQKNNLPIRVIKGCYGFHTYRLMKHSRDRTHLKIWT